MAQGRVHMGHGTELTEAPGTLVCGPVYKEGAGPAKTAWGRDRKKNAVLWTW